MDNKKSRLLSHVILSSPTTIFWIRNKQIFNFSLSKNKIEKYYFRVVGSKKKIILMLLDMPIPINR